MSLNLNKIILAGRLTARPELKRTSAGLDVTGFTIAVDRRIKREETDFIRCVAWRQTAEFVCKHFDKGAPICVCGSLQCRSYTDAQGNKRTVYEVVVDEAMFVASNLTGEAQAPAASVAPSTPAVPVQPSFEDISTDDDLPF